MSLTLLLLRHAKTHAHAPTGQDHDRELTARGEQDALSVGEFLAAEKLAAPTVLCSTSARTRATAELLLRSAHYAMRGAPKLIYLRELYLAEPEDIVQCIRNFGESSPLLVVGHNPGLEELLPQLCRRNVEMKTAALAQLECPIAEWPDLTTNGNVRLVRVWRPEREL